MRRGARAFLFVEQVRVRQDNTLPLYVKMSMLHVRAVPRLEGIPLVVHQDEQVQIREREFVCFFPPQESP